MAQPERSDRPSAATPRIGPRAEVLAANRRVVQIAYVPSRRNGRSTVARLQGWFYVATGAWPLLDVRSFQAVTGPKVDLWLVRAVGVLVLVIGTVLLQSRHRRQPADEIALLGAGCALGLALIDIVFASTGRIAPVYFADAAVEMALAVGWGLACVRGAHPVRRIVHEPRERQEPRWN